MCARNRPALDERLEHLKATLVPILVVGGARDNLVSIRSSIQLGRLLEAAQHIFEDAGHGCTEQHADAVCAGKIVRTSMRPSLLMSRRSVHANGPHSDLVRCSYRAEYPGWRAGSAGTLHG